MGIEAGQQLLHYRLIEKIGEGGMGMVWKAVDTDLGREVAIKVLPEAFASDAERLTRFEREARLLASLSHPGIAAIYGLHECDTATPSTGSGQAGSLRFLAMELVQGDDLSIKLSAGKLSIDDALDVAGQICDAFAAAHDAGVVHRDLKPANVMLTPEGKVKVLDFGLAKALVGDAASGAAVSASLSPTMTSAGTQVGMILGTAAYMSPEQARGKPVDRRADIWSLGCMFFEMLTGHSVFAGDTITDTLAAVVRADPDWESLPAETPASIRRVLRRALEKDPARRLRDAADVRLEIDDARAELGEPEASTASVGASTAEPRGRGLGVVAGVVLALLLGVAIGWALGPGDTAVPGSVRRFSFVTEPLTKEGSHVFGRRQALDISADGEVAVFVGKDQIFLRRMDQSAPVPVSGTEGATLVELSPDGEWLGFARGSTLYKIPMRGGSAVAIAEMPADDSAIGAAAWSGDGTIYLAAGYEGYQALYKVSDQGGVPEWLIEVSDEEGVRRDVGAIQLLDDERLLFTITPGNAIMHARNSRVVVLDLPTGELTTVAESAGFGRYVPSGHLVTAKGSGTLQLQPFDLRTLKATGTPVPLRGDLVEYSDGMLIDLAFSDDGTLIHTKGLSGALDHEVVWWAADGSQTLLLDETRPYTDVKLSPDGRHAVMSLDGDRQKLWLYDISRDNLTLLTADDHDYASPIWTPDGQLIYLRSQNGQDPRVWRWDVLGGEPPEVVFDPGTIWYQPESISPDGGTLAGLLWDPDTDTHWDVLLTSLAGDPVEHRFAASPRDEMHAAFSPDGGWLAYVSNRSGDDEVYIKAFPERGAAIKVSDGGTRPFWDHAGDALYYIGNQNAFMRVDFDAGAPPRLGTPKRVADLPQQLAPGSWRTWGGIAPDGRMLLVRRNEPTLTRIDVVLNWFEELRRISSPD